MKLNSILFSIFCLCIFQSCGNDKVDATTTKEEKTTEASPDPEVRYDHHSFAYPKEAYTKHLDLRLKVDFDQKVLSGKAQFQIQNNNAKQIIFDSKNLIIEKVTIGKEEKEAKFTLSRPVRFKGQALNVAIEPTTDLVSIYYSTKPDGAEALDWLDASQTADKKFPFLFTQGQAILTRSWIPCQDSPGIRITYNARIEVPEGMMAVMSASNPQTKNDSGVYTFKMRQPIPPYLLALAVGDLKFGMIGPRTGVYAEPSMLKKSVYEFGDMEKMLTSAEALYGPYSWERYDVIVLPPSFPFGGMENPRLTFATPTIIAGDRSLTSLIAHELAHSWSGNLVTNATWNDFWLNEGFTVYFERRIMESLYGEDYVGMLKLLGYQDLEEDVQELGPKSEDTHLMLDLKDRDPDDGMTDIAYEKGAFFLEMLERKAGRDKFDLFLKTYFDEHKFKTITTAEFINYLNTNLINKHSLDVNIDEWINGPGIPASCPEVSSARFAFVDAQIKSLVEGEASKTVKGKSKEWTTHEWLHFIRHLPVDIGDSKMVDLDNTFGFSKSGNCEILHAWFVLAAKNGYSAKILPAIEEFLVTVGRRKFLTPLYRAFKDNDGLATAQAIYKKARPNYHAVSRNTMDALLKE